MLIQEVLFDAVVTAPLEAYWTSLVLNKSEFVFFGVSCVICTRPESEAWFPIEPWWLCVFVKPRRNSDKGVEIAYLGTRTGLSRINLFVVPDEITNQ